MLLVNMRWTSLAWSLVAPSSSPRGGWGTRGYRRLPLGPLGSLVSGLLCGSGLSEPRLKHRTAGCSRWAVLLSWWGEDSFVVQMVTLGIASAVSVLPPATVQVCGVLHSLLFSACPYSQQGSARSTYGWLAAFTAGVSGDGGESTCFSAGTDPWLKVPMPSPGRGFHILGVVPIA